MKPLALLIAACSLLWAASLDSKISDSRKDLKASQSAYGRMDRKLSKTGRSIEKNSRLLASLETSIASLDKELGEKLNLLGESQGRLGKINTLYPKLQEEKEALRKRQVDLIANRYVLAQVSREAGVADVEGLIEGYLLDAIVSHEKQRLQALTRELEQTGKRLQNLESEKQTLEKVVADLKEKKVRLARQKSAKVRLLDKLGTQKASYEKSLRRLLREQDTLQKTLSKLNILKKEAIKRQEAQARAKAGSNLKLPSNDLKVRNIGSSYQRHPIGRYRGKKTFSPVGKARVVKKFGTYTDPIYKIKVFNESIELKPESFNSKVKNVLNGKVVFAEDTAMLGKVVIVEHARGLHTIYAKMSKIAPTIRVGKKIRSGYVVGRVEDRLMFEVTQKNRHINPLELITLQ